MYVDRHTRMYRLQIPQPLDHQRPLPKSFVRFGNLLLKQSVAWAALPSPRARLPCPWPGWDALWFGITLFKLSCAGAQVNSSIKWHFSNAGPDAEEHLNNWSRWWNDHLARDGFLNPGRRDSKRGDCVCLCVHAHVCVRVLVWRVLCYQRSAEPAKAPALLPGWAGHRAVWYPQHAPVGASETESIIV